MQRSWRWPFRALIGSLLVAVSSCVWAWPERTVRIIVPFGPGGYPDTTARIVAERLSKETGGTFIVENRPGASGKIGLAQVGKANPDGYTFGLATNAQLTLYPMLYKSLPYELSDFVLVSKAITTSSVLAVAPSLGVSNVQELIALLKPNPGKHNYAMSGTGSFSHLVGEAISAKSGGGVQSIVFNSSPQTIGALMRGEVTYILLPASSILPLANAGRMKVLSVTSGKRLSFAPDIPTLKELGVEIDADSWLGFVAPAGTPAEAVDAFRAGMIRALSNPELRARLAEQYLEVVVNPSAAQFAAEIKAEADRWRPVVNHLNIRLD